MKKDKAYALIFLFTFSVISTCTLCTQKMWLFNEKEFIEECAEEETMETDSILIKIENGEDYKFRRFGEN